MWAMEGSARTGFAMVIAICNHSRDRKYNLQRFALMQ
jgi:hypothetical protein